MYKRTDKIAIFEQTTLPRIMLLLREKGKASRTELRNAIEGSQVAIYNAISILARYELIEEETRDAKIEIYLSDKGKKIAEELVALEKLL